MADLIDTLQKKVDRLQRLLRAQESGIPDKLVVMVTGHDATNPEGIKQAIADELKRYGLEDEEQAFEAGCTVIPAPLPWLTNRTIGKTLKPSEDNYSDSGDFS